jgi:hypothetical protein
MYSSAARINSGSSCKYPMPRLQLPHKQPTKLTRRVVVINRQRTTRLAALATHRAYAVLLLKHGLILL